MPPLYKVRSVKHRSRKSGILKSHCAGCKNNRYVKKLIILRRPDKYGMMTKTQTLKLCSSACIGIAVMAYL